MKPDHRTAADIYIYADDPTRRRILEEHRLSWGELMEALAREPHRQRLAEHRDMETQTMLKAPDRRSGVRW
jgi:hypothetical protein